MRSLLAGELAELLPGGVEGLTYANMISLRFPVEVALTEQSSKAKVLEILEAEMADNGQPTGFEPAAEENGLVVSFVTCVVHGVRH
jgi:hypothetical protein